MLAVFLIAAGLVAVVGLSLCAFDLSYDEELEEAMRTKPMTLKQFLKQ